MNTIRVIDETIVELHYGRRIADLLALGVDTAGLEHIDDAERVVPGMVRVDGKWSLPAPSPQVVAAKIKSECSRRIYAVMSDAAQKNITAYITDLSIALSERDLTADELSDVSVARSARGWVASMQQAVRLAVANGTDPVWPDVPAGVAELVERF